MYTSFAAGAAAPHAIFPLLGYFSTVVRLPDSVGGVSISCHVTPAPLM